MRTDYAMAAFPWKIHRKINEERFMMTIITLVLVCDLLDFTEKLK